MTNKQREEATVTTPSEREIATERVFDAPRGLVYKAMTDPELIPEWWGRETSTIVVDEMDMRPGGAWRFVEHSPDGSENAFRGTYRKIEPPEMVEMTFEWEGMPGYVAVETMTLEDRGEQTRIKTLTLFHTTEERDGMLEAGMSKGLNESYAKLDALLEELASA